jgi:hypothetical protein
LKVPIGEIISLLEKEPKNNIHPASIGAIDAAIDVWCSCNRKKTIPKFIFRNKVLMSFINDCFQVFEVNEDPSAAYKNWYELTQK